MTGIIRSRQYRFFFKTLLYIDEKDLP